jgi:hypothetical protein
VLRHDEASSHRQALMLDYLRHGSLIASVGRYSGLGNRMRTVLGAQSLAELERRHFAYCWPTGARFGTTLDELWDMKADTVPLWLTRGLSLRYPFRDGVLAWLDDDARAERIWQIRTGQPLALAPQATPWTERLRALRPAPEIGRRVEEFYGRHLRDHPYVGVMIRAHEVSHARTREHSPVEWFIARMHAIRAVDPRVRFFVSCDVAEVQDTVTAVFQSAVGLRDKGAYNSGAGIRSAVVDLYLLASSSHLLGPHYSSFPELALHLGGPALALETSMTSPELAWERRLPTTSTVHDPTRPSVRS